MNTTSLKSTTQHRPDKAHATRSCPGPQHQATPRLSHAQAPLQSQPPNKKLDQAPPPQPASTCDTCTIAQQQLITTNPATTATLLDRPLARTQVASFQRTTNTRREPYFLRPLSDPLLTTVETPGEPRWMPFIDLL